ncbi:MFS transporter [Chloroflexota bacterium]
MSGVKRIARRGDLLAIFAMIFLVDVAIGIYRATISLYASSLGATLTMIGILGAVEGLTVLLVALPIGGLSDRIDRRTVVGGGLLLFTAAYLLCSVASTPLLLYPSRALIGVSVAATFYVGIAFISDIVEEADRGLTIGIYTTCMGLGFALGAVLGGRIAEDVGYRAGYLVAAVVVLVSLALLRWGPARQGARPRPAKVGKSEPLSAKLALLGRKPVLLAACLGYMGIAMANEGAIFNFFPLYAASLSIGVAFIGTMFSVRMLFSSAVRVPTGALVNKLSSRRLMIAALVLSMTSLFGIAFSTDPAILIVLLVGEGVAFGMYFVAGSAAVAEQTSEANRGTATGLFIMAGSIGVMLGPLALGAAADRWGLNTVFLFTAIVLMAVVIVILTLSARSRGGVSESSQ